MQNQQDYQRIFDLSQNPQHSGHMEDPTMTADGANFSCGDEIHWEIKLNPDGTVAHCLHQCRACAICKVSADIVAQKANGTSSQIALMSNQDIIEAIGIPLSPSRMKCAILPLEILNKKLKEFWEESK